jgi:hypothetical protein
LALPLLLVEHPKLRVAQVRTPHIGLFHNFEPASSQSCDQVLILAAIVPEALIVSVQLVYDPASVDAEEDLWRIVPADAAPLQTLPHWPH